MLPDYLKRNLTVGTPIYCIHVSNIKISFSGELDRDGIKSRRLFLFLILFFPFFLFVPRRRHRNITLFLRSEYSYRAPVVIPIYVGKQAQHNTIIINQCGILY